MKFILSERNYSSNLLTDIIYITYKYATIYLYI